MNRKKTLAAMWLAVLAIGLIGLPAVTSAQGVQTGTLTGTVEDSQGLPVPGVTITVKSPALQGERVSTSSATGGYIFRGLPIGSYSVNFVLQGMRDITDTVQVTLGTIAQVNAVMAPAAVTETVMVTADISPQVITNLVVGANIPKEELDLLPSGRRPQDIALLAPNLNNNTPNASQLQIAGSFAYDNVFLVDGVDVNDNLFGSPNNLFIEDAIEETQVLTSGISAEYGRFSGGVINVVTKSGGNDFSGSFRTFLTNDAWKAKTPFQVRTNATITDKVIKNYEATLGGPILRDRLWFFAAGRLLPKSAVARTLPESGVDYTFEDENKRGQIKLTGSINSNHQITGSYLNNATKQQRVAFTQFPSLYTIDPFSIERPSFPNTQLVTNYRGVLSSKLFLEAQYSRKKYAFEGAGGTSTAIVDSPFLGLSALAQYNAPYFDATDPEDRDNHQYAGSLQYLLVKPGLGTHDFKGGFEAYTSTRTGGNSQTATGYVFYSDYLKTASGAPVYDSQGRFIPVFEPGASLSENWLATRNARQDISTTSFYFQDRWNASARLSLDLGLRYERVKAEATGDVVQPNTNTIVPRLGVSYDTMGDGRLLLQGTYAHYSGKASENQFGENTSVGNPTALYGEYIGPPGQGRSFAPGFDPANYEIYDGDFPLANVFLTEGLTSPITREFTLQAGGEIGRNGFAKVIYVNRSMSNFIEDFITTETGSTTVIQNGINFGTFSNRVYRNSDDPSRKYAALVFQGRQRFNARWMVEGNYTIQITGEGNFEGEAANQPAISTRFGDYPEIITEDRWYPVGTLDDYQRHRAQIWSTYQMNMGRAGNASVSPIVKINSAQYYSLAATNVPLSTIQANIARNAGYATLPAPGTMYFAEGRGSEPFKGYAVLDFAANYDIPIFRSTRPFVQVILFNLTGNDKLIKWNTTVTRNTAGPVDSLGLPTTYTKGATFGTGTANTHYPLPREFRITFGLRF
jgi:outer membrane receptor protein involved in Fe transport